MSTYITPHVSLCSSLWNPFLLPPTKPPSGNHGSAVTIDKFPFSSISIKWCFEGGICFFYRAYSSWDSPSHCIYEESAPFHCWVAFQCIDLSIHVLVDSYIISTFWQPQIKLPWTLYTSLCLDICCYFSWLHICKNGIAGHMLSVCWTFKETAKLFLNMAVPFHITTSSM